MSCMHGRPPSWIRRGRYRDKKSFTIGSLRCFRATTSVRKPSRAMLPHSSSSQSLYRTMGASTASAPLR